MLSVNKNSNLEVFYWCSFWKKKTVLVVYKIRKSGNTETTHLENNVCV